MDISFDLGRVRTVEFGVEREDVDGTTYSLVSVDADVQNALIQMVEATLRELAEMEPGERFSPAEKYASRDYVYLPLVDDLAENIRRLHEAANVPNDANAVQDPRSIYSYFTRLTDSQGRRLTGVRRAMQFKGILKARLIRLVNDSLRILDDDVFKLDPDFDLVADDTNVHVLRPSSFEFLGQLQEAVMAAVTDNVAVLKRDADFIDFTPIEEYSSRHPRAARYLASIRAQGAVVAIDRRALRRLCKRTGVSIESVKGKLTVPEDHVLGFLEVLDRRRYEIELVNGSPERFKAASRSRLRED